MNMVYGGSEVMQRQAFRVCVHSCAYAWIYTVLCIQKKLL